MIISRKHRLLPIQTLSILLLRITKRKLSDFLDRFQGKVSQISKDGHLGVVARTSKPIEKVVQTPDPNSSSAQLNKEPIHLISDDEEDNQGQKRQSKFQNRKLILKGKIKLSNNNLGSMKDLSKFQDLTSKQSDQKSINNSGDKFNPNKNQQLINSSQGNSIISNAKHIKKQDKLNDQLQNLSSKKSQSKIQTPLQQENQIRILDTQITSPSQRQQQQFIYQGDQGFQNPPQIMSTQDNQGGNQQHKTFSSTFQYNPHNFMKDQASYFSQFRDQIQAQPVLNQPYQNMQNYNSAQNYMNQNGTQLNSYQQHQSQQYPQNSNYPQQQQLNIGLQSLNSLSNFSMRQRPMNNSFIATNNFSSQLQNQETMITSPNLQLKSKFQLNNQDNENDLIYQKQGYRSNSLINERPRYNTMNPASTVQTPINNYNSFISNGGLLGTMPRPLQYNTNQAMSFSATDNFMMTTPKQQTSQFNPLRASHSVTRKPTSNGGMGIGELTFTNIGQSIMRRTDYQSMQNISNEAISNKKLFSRSGGIGAATVGTDDWQRAKDKQDRMQNFIRQIKLKGDLQ
eukprot:403348253